MFQNNETLQFASGLKYRSDAVWTMTSRLQNYIIANVSENEANYRVVRGDAWTLTVGTSCHKSGAAGVYTDRPQGISGYRPFIFQP